jgi:hypothetical protein
MKQDNNGRQWRLIDRRPGVELWRADDDGAHGFAVCDPGDEPDHATWSTTTTEAIARKWFEPMIGTYAGLRAVFVRHYAGNMIEIRVPGGLIVVDRQHFLC